MKPIQTTTQTEEGGRRCSPGPAVVAVFGIGLCAVLAEIAMVCLGVGSVTVRNAFVTTASFAGAAIALLTAASRPRGARGAWTLLGLGIFSYSLGSLIFFFFLKTLTSFPSTADLSWLAFYPLVVVAVILLARGQRRSVRLAISLDAAIVTLAFAAVSYELIFNALIDTGVATDVVGGQLSYSVLDFGLLVMLTLVCVPSRARVGRAYFALGAGLLVMLISDVLVVRGVSNGTYAPGTLLDAGWPAAMLLLGMATRLDTRLEGVRALRGPTLYGAIVLSFAVTFGLLIVEMLGDRDPIVITLAALVPCLILIRLVAAVKAYDRLAQDNEGIISAAGEGIFRNDVEGRITYANPAAASMLGYSVEEMLGQRSHQLFHHTRANGTAYPASACPAGKSLTAGATRRITDELFWRKDGSGLAVDYTSAPIREGGRIVGVVTVFDDVTHQRQMKEQLRHQADHDSLTGLFNRRRFEQEVSRQLEYAQRYSRPGALLLMDLDTFKFVNDSYGHPIGDQVLSDVGASLSATVRGTDVVARIGGDEFVVLLREASELEAVAVAKKLIVAIRERSTPTIGASVGIAAFDGAGEKTPDELLVAADIALYEAKEMGGGTTVLYTGQSSQALTWVERIRAALAENRLVVHSQPIVDLETGGVAREELLVRMVDPHGDKIPPASFLPAAERFGLIHEIDLMVLTRAIQLVEEGASVAVNVSVRTLTDPRYLTALEAALADGANPGRFNFEITETAAVANMSDAQEFARRIRELGCSLSLDDFGTGFSSFTYLKHIPAQFLKIDIEFIRELEKNPADQQLVQAIVAIAHGLGQKTVAEGVEDEETLATVRRLGVDYAQGFHLGRPEPIDPDPSATARPNLHPTRESTGVADGAPRTRT
ncbi:MAG TPA: EAL domain-containing protein [Solirubrobacterales bacterium]|nr:EAL domain-containing protein [Solirubrobacterales bacterium]